MNEIITTILWSAPLSVVLTTAIAWLLRSWIAERLTSSVRHQYNKDLELHKATLKAQFDSALEADKTNMQHRFHVDKSQFDMEFESFQKIYSSLSNLVDATARLINSFLHNGPDDKELIIKYAKAADEAYFITSNVSNELRPFMPEDIYSKHTSIKAACKAEINWFFYEMNEPLEKYKKDMDLCMRVQKELKMTGDSIVHELEHLVETIRDRLEWLSSEESKAQPVNKPDRK